MSADPIQVIEDAYHVHFDYLMNARAESLKGLALSLIDLDEDYFDLHGEDIINAVDQKAIKKMMDLKCELEVTEN